MNKGAEGKKMRGGKRKKSTESSKEQKANILFSKIIEKSSSTRFQTLGYAFSYGWSYDIWILESGKGNSGTEVCILYFIFFSLGY